MKITLDTNVLISATLWSGSVSQKVLLSLIKGNHEIFSSIDILNEYQRILMRDFGYGQEESAEIIENLLSFLNIVTPTEKISAVKDDETDNRILECASASSSQYVLTYDKHLLKLERYGQIEIITPENIREKLTRL